MKIVQFIREKSNSKCKGKPIGVFVALYLPKQAKYADGWVRAFSMCNPKDQWNRKLGTQIAIGRAMRGRSNSISNEFFKSSSLKERQEALYETAAMVNDRIARSMKNENKEK